MSERKSICKRNVEHTETEFENLSNNLSPLKKMRLDDSTDSNSDSDVVRTGSSLAYSASDSGGFSVVLAGEDDHQSSSISSSGCSSSETNEITVDFHQPNLDLEPHQISKTEISTFLTTNFRNPLSEILGETAKMDSTSEATTKNKDRRKPDKAPTQAELDEFFSATEKYEQKRFIEKYNYDIVNDTPLEGRYQWVRLKP